MEERYGRLIPVEFLVDGKGVEIEARFARGWSFVYRGGDLQFKLIADPDRRVPPAANVHFGGNDTSLGPICVVKLDFTTLSRPLTPKDLPEIAANLKEALHIHEQVTSASSPRVERVRFFDEGLKSFDE